MKQVPYFESAEILSGYERKTGSKASAYLAELAEDIVHLINQAYEDGYKAGLKESQN